MAKSRQNRAPRPNPKADFYSAKDTIIRELGQLLEQPTTSISEETRYLLCKIDGFFPETLSLTYTPETFEIYLQSRNADLHYTGRTLITEIQAIDLQSSSTTELAALRHLATVYLALRDIQYIISMHGKASETPPSARSLNIKQVVAHSSAIILALEDVLNYDPLRHHNNPPPAMRLETATYLNDVQELIKQLRRLNGLLESRKAKAAQTSKVAAQLSQNLQKFLDNYIPYFAKGTAVLTVAAMAGLLVQLGVGSPVIEKLFSTIRLLR